MITNFSKMKKTLLTIVVCLIGFTGFSQTRNQYVPGYIKPSTGTYVEGYNRTLPNNTNIDNYSTFRYTNLYTGNVGTKPQDYSTGASSYGQGQIIYTGPKGGQYYINGNGNKTYVPKQPW